MNVVEPIRDINDLNKIRAELKKYNEMYYLIFEIGISVGLRVSDILSLTVSDVKDDVTSIKEQKTGKTKQFKIKPELKSEILNYVKKNNRTRFIFETSWSKCSGEHIKRIQVYRVLNKCAQKAGYFQKIGTHTMRKTFGYHFYKQTKDVVLLQKIFNHSSPAVTLLYIGITQDRIDEAYDRFQYVETPEEQKVTNEMLFQRIKYLEKQIDLMNNAIVNTIEYALKGIKYELQNQ